MKKRIMGLGLVLIMSTSMFGCGTKSETGTATTAPKTETSKPGTTDGDNAPEPTEEGKVVDNSIFDRYEAKDMGGRVIKTSSHFKWFVDSTLDTEPKPEDSGYIGNMATYENRLRVEQKYNVKFETITLPWGETPAQLATSVMAGDPFCDMVLLDPAYFAATVVNNQILPIKDFALPNTDLMTEQKYIKSSGKLLGEEYFFDTVGRDDDGNEVLTDAIFMGFNRDILNSVGAEDPVALYRAGNWTFDKFLELARQCTKDTDGDGRPDIFGFSSQCVLAVQSFIAANDGTIFDDINRIQTFDNPKTIKALDILNTLYNVDKVVYTTDNGIWDWDANRDLWREGKSAFFECRRWMIPDAPNQVTFDFGVVPFPKGPDNTTDAAFFRFLNGTAMVRGTKDPSDVYQIYEEIRIPYKTELNVDLPSNPAEWLESKFTTEEDLQMLVEISSKCGKTDNYNTLQGFDMGKIVGPIVDGSKTAAQSVEENKQILQDAIDTAMKKAEPATEPAAE